METDNPNFFQKSFKILILLICILSFTTSCNKERTYIHWMQEQRFVIKTVHGKVYNQWCDCHIKLNNVYSTRDSINCFTPSGERLNEYDLGYKSYPITNKIALSK